MALHLGELEELVLLAVQGRGEMSASSIRAALLDAGREISAGGLYPTLARLQAKKALSGQSASAQPVRGGRARMLYRLTNEGENALQNCESLRNLLRLQKEEQVASSETQDIKDL